jgi:hypothetical protein
MKAIWTPQLGPQLKAVTSPADFTFFGGSRGGGKSDCTIGRQIAGADRYGKHWNGLITRRNYKDLRELRRRWDELISYGLPAVRTGGELQTNYIKFANSAMVQLVAIESLRKVEDYIGHQYTEISIEEATTVPFFGAMVDKLKGSNRSPHGVPCHMFATGNPGGAGHMQVKEYFRLGSSGVTPETIIRIPLAGGYEETRVFIPSFLDDNKILCQNDPMYVARLKSIKDPALRKAWLDGDWDVFIGQAFSFMPDYHVIEPMDIPSNANIYMAFDWGYGAPFSIVWAWVDHDGRIIIFAEWYGWNGSPGEGLRLVDTEIGRGIIEREKRWGLDSNRITRLAGPDCWNKKPDYKGGGQGPSTAEVFSGLDLYMTPGDPSRLLKIRQFRERLAYSLDETGHLDEPPMLLVQSNCEHVIRTIPALAVDDTNPEDIDTDQEDHVYDAICHICMARPIAIAQDEPIKTEAERIFDEITSPQDDEFNEIFEPLTAGDIPFDDY